MGYRVQSSYTDRFSCVTHFSNTIKYTDGFSSTIKYADGFSNTIKYTDKFSNTIKCTGFSSTTKEYRRVLKFNRDGVLLYVYKKY